MKTPLTESRAATPPSELPSRLIADPATVDAVEGVLSGIADLHSAPPIVQKVLEITRCVDFEIRELTDVLAGDPALCAKILRLANSASYALPRQITGVRHAIAVLGHRTLRLLVLTFSLVDKLTRGVGREMYAAYWQRALTTAVVAAKLSRSRRGVDPDQAYSAGLLADLGILVMAQKDSDHYPSLYLAHAHDESLLAAESDRFGCNHAEVGACLLERWGFSRECCVAALNHHDLRPCQGDLELVVLAASMTAQMLWHPNPDLVANTRSLLRAEFDCDTDKLINLVLHCKEEIAQQADLYGVDRCDEIDSKRLVEQARKLFLSASLEAAMDFDAAMAIIDRQS